MNIKVLGWYNHGNTGDEAYKVAFPLLFPGHTFEFVESIAADDKSDVVILGGGDVFYPSFTEQVNALPSHVKTIAASISLTDNSDFGSIMNFDKVIVRDKRSVELAKKHFSQVTYMPDFAFLMTPNAEAGNIWIKKRFAEEGHALFEKKIVCVMSNYLAYSKLSMLARDLTAFLSFSQNVAQSADNINASFIFLPFSTKAPWDDRVSNSWVADRCKFYDKNIVVWEKLDVQTTLDIIAASDACVSSRLHSTIFSVLSGVPFLDITHHTKNLGFIETLGKQEWSMPFWEFSIKDYMSNLNTFISSPQKNNSLLEFTRTSKEQLSAATIL